MFWVPGVSKDAVLSALAATEAVHARYTGAGWKAESIAAPGGGAALGVRVERLCLSYMEPGFCIGDHGAEGMAGPRGVGHQDFD